MKTAKNLAIVLALWFGVSGAVVVAGGFESTPQGTRYKELQLGQGTSANYGDVAVMHFMGWLANDGQRGREIFNTRNRGKPVSFVVGTDRVMQGWNDGVIGMRPGGRRLLLVPPARAYGNKAVQGVVPAGASLMFLIELLEVEKPG